jgi:hypothetical protein
LHKDRRALNIIVAPKSHEEYSYTRNKTISTSRIEKKPHQWDIVGKSVMRPAPEYSVENNDKSTKKDCQDGTPKVN